MSEKNIKANRVEFLKTKGFDSIEADTEERILEVLRDLKAQNNAMIHAYQLFIDKSTEDSQGELFKASYDRAVEDNIRITVLLQ